VPAEEAATMVRISPRAAASGCAGVTPSATNVSPDLILLKL
jgi:hypothetical protein